MGELHRIPQASGAAERAFADGGLTGRERDAARSVLAGMTAQAAASVMGVDAETVASYRRRAYRKLGVTDARGLVARLGEKGAGDGRDWRPALRERGLSDTQAEVLARVAAGRSSSEIAGELHLAPGTVSSARANGYRLLGVHSREGLLAELEAGESAGRGRAGAPARRRASRLAAACVAAAVLLAALVAGGEALLTAAADTSAEPDTVQTEFGEMPNVVGMGPQEAWDELVGAGYLPTLQRARSDEKPGTVVGEEARALSEGYAAEPFDPSGTAHPELAQRAWHAEVVLSVSGMRQVPLGLTTDSAERAARKALKDAGFTNIATDDRGDVDSVRNRVVSVSPAPGAWALPDETVTLTVTSDTTVPQVSGMTPLDASSAITHAGLTPDPNVTAWGYTGEGTPAAVMTDPAPGEAARVGDVVHVTYDGPLDDE